MKGPGLMEVVYPRRLSEVIVSHYPNATERFTPIVLVRQTEHAPKAHSGPKKRCCVPTYYYVMSGT